MEDLWKITEKLENISDEALAVSLLMEFNEKTRAHHKLIQNTDPDLIHETWKKKCDKAKVELELVINKILRHSN